MDRLDGKESVGRPMAGRRNVMTVEQKYAIEELRKRGLSFAKIAMQTGLSVNTVKSYYRRLEEKKRKCRHCGKPLIQMGNKKKSFCSDNCRAKWWNRHREQLNSAVLYKLTCAGCGKEFDSYGNKKRKYCCHPCYIRHRFGTPIYGAPKALDCFRQQSNDVT